MPKRRVEGYGQNQRRNGDLACKRSRPERRWKHLCLVLDDWEKGYSIHKIDLVSFDSDSDDNHDSSRVAVAGHLLEPPVVRLESPGDVDMLFATMGNKIFIVRHHGTWPCHSCSSAMWLQYCCCCPWNVLRIFTSSL